MIKWMILLLYLIKLTAPVQIEVDYDAELDLISKGDVIYLPVSQSNPLDKPVNIMEVADNTTLVFNKEEKEEKEEKEGHGEELVTGGTFWFFILIVICKNMFYDFLKVLTLFAGLMSGLTVGYLSIDILVLELRSSSGTDEEKRYASTVLPILENRHWLLVTLLLMNAFAMEALPVFLDRMVSRILAVCISVTLVLFVGEVIPQAICTGPSQVKIAAAVAPITRFLMLVSWPISFWIAKALDILLGEHHKSRFLNSDLKTLVELHTYQALKQLAEEEEKHAYINKDEIAKPSDKMGLNEMEANLMISALEIRERKVSEIMIPFERVFLIDFDEKIEKPQFRQILEKGYSRIPVYRNHNKQDIIGLIRIKQLILIELSKGSSLKEIGIPLKHPIVIHPNMTLMEVLRQFNQGKSHMAFITEQVEKLQGKLGLNRTNSLAIENQYLRTAQGDLGITVLGIITLEDVIEHIFNFEILDEDDYEKAKLLKGKTSQRTNSKITTMFTRDVAKNFIQEESEKIDALIKEGSKNKSIKEQFMTQMDVYSSNDKQTQGLKKPLIN